MAVRKLSEIASILGLTLQGADADIKGVSTLEAATSQDLSFLANPKYSPHLATTRAAAVIVSPDHASKVACALVSEHPYQDFGRAVTLFATPQGEEQGISPLAFVHPDAVIGAGVTLYPSVFVGARAVIGDNVSLFAGVYIGEDCCVGADSIVYPNVTLMAGTVVGERCILHPGAVLGSDGFGYATTDTGIEKIPQVGRVRLGNDVEIGANTTIDRAVLDLTVIDDGTKIDNLVQIGHNVRIGRHCFLVSQVGISGSCTIGDRCTMAGQVGVAGHLHVGNDVTIGPQSGVARDIADGATVGGSPAVDQGTFMRTLALMPSFPNLFKRLSKVEKALHILQELTQKK